MKKLFAVVLFFVSMVAVAQNEAVEMADVMRSNGKIYVLLAVVLVVFMGLGFYLFWVEKKVDKIDKH